MKTERCMKTEKRCSRCNTVKPSTEFFNSKKADGLSYWCKDCYREYDGSRNAARASRRRSPYYCPRCQQTLTAADFNWQRSGRRYSYCKPCMNANVKAWMKDNPAKNQATIQRRKARKFTRILRGESA